MNIFVTGGTGFIGQRLVKKLASAGHHLILLTRPQSLLKAKKIFEDLKDITFVQGDICDTDVLKDTSAVFQHLNSIDVVIHLAAHYDLHATMKDTYLGNIIGTQNMINLMNKMGSLKYFYYFSTYAVNPLSKGTINEDYLIDQDQLLPDHYSKSKNHAEHIVRKQLSNRFKTIILRPGIVIGDSVTGEFDKKDGPYYYFDFISNLKKVTMGIKGLTHLPVPTTPEANFPVIPVDVLTDWCAKIIQNPPTRDLSCYHLVPAPEIKTKDFLEYSMRLQGFPVKILPIKYTKLVAPLLPLVKIPKEAAVYMNQETHFDTSNLRTDYPELKCPPYEDYLPTLISEYQRQLK